MTLDVKFDLINEFLVHLDDSEDMGGRSTEFGLRSADYEQDGGDETVNFDAQLSKLSIKSTPFQMDLQRRGHTGELGPNKGRVYWRCYFNAVTCF